LKARGNKIIAEWKCFGGDSGAKIRHLRGDTAEAFNTEVGTPEIDAGRRNGLNRIIHLVKDLLFLNREIYI